MNQLPTITTPTFKHLKVRIVYELAVSGCIPYHGPLPSGQGWDAEVNISPDEEPVALYFTNFDINFENLHNYNMYLGYH